MSTTTSTIVSEVEDLSRNKDLADALALIASYYEMARDTYRARAFATASAKIAAYPTGIESGTEARANIVGVGASIEEAIDEFFASYDQDRHKGHISRLDELERQFNEQRTVIDYFMSFYGIGPVKAVALYNQNLRTLEDIWTKGNLTEAQKIGILWRDHLKLRISRDEMDLINQKIGTLLNPYGIKWTIAGSYRRGETSSGDIDILIESRSDLNMDGVVNLLQSILPATLAVGPSKFMGIVRLDDQHNGHRIDIRLINPESYQYALLYFTGSQRVNILMRQRAIEFGLTLNEYGLFNRDGQSYPANSEEDIFQMLRIRYLPPESRLKTINRLEFI